MPSRQVFFKETLATANVSSNVFAEVANLTFTNVASAAYFVGGNWSVRAAEQNNKVFSLLQYMETGATTTLCNFGWSPGATAADVDHQFAIRRIISPTSVGTQNFSLRLAVSANTKMSEIRDARLWAIKATAADAYVEKVAAFNQEMSAGGTGWNGTICSVAFTPASQGNYIVIGQAGARSQPSTRNQGLRVVHQGTAGPIPSYLTTWNSGNSFNSYPLINVINMAAGSNVLELQTGMSAAAAITAKTEDAKIVALRADAFNSFMVESSIVTAAISSATYVTALTTTFSMTGELKYGILISSRTRATNTANFLSTQYVIDNVTAGVETILPQGAASDAIWAWFPNAMLVVVTASQGTHQARIQGRRSVATSDLAIADQHIIVFQFDATVAAASGEDIIPKVYHQFSILHQ